jgi:toxin ParE1/3/4
MAPPKPVILSEDADADIDSILLWTREQFGSRQASLYHDRIIDLLEGLASDPTPTSSKAREHDVGPGYRTAHLGRRARHLVLYRVEPERVLIVRILHDGMDVSRHLPSEE